MAKRKLPKIKVSKDTGNTVIKVAGLGLVAFFAYKMFANNENSTGFLGGGYSGSGTDLSGILPFFQETPPVFNISNPPIPNSFFIDTSTALSDITEPTKKEKLIEETNKEKSIEWGVGIPYDTSNSVVEKFLGYLNPQSWGKIPTEKQYNEMVADYSQFSIFNSKQAKNLGGSIISSLIPFPISLLLNATPASACPSGKCPTVYNSDYNYSNPKLDIPSFQSSFTVYTPKKSITSYSTNDFVNAQSFLGELRKNVAPTTVTYTKKDYDVHSETRRINEILANNVTAQNKLATSLASGNCGNAISTNQCTGTKKETNYATTVSSGVRYYENTRANTPSHLITVSH